MDDTPKMMAQGETQVAAFQMSPLLDRSINAGLSGGEIKRSELIQMAAMRPQFVLLDEPESGVDIESLELVGEMVHALVTPAPSNPRSIAALLVTHNYCSLRPAKSVQSQPRTWLEGTGSTTKHLTVILGSRGSAVETGGEIYLNGDDSRAELAHRAVCNGGRIFQRGLLIGNAKCRAHVDCAGLVLDAGGGGFIQSIPGLQALHPEAQMSHEASIGRIAPEQVEYLQTRGLDEREAISLIVRGYLGADIIGLGPELDARIVERTELAGHGET